jgi:putative colanic acid biosynthesis UDP-glucose lipid carrier transferase
MRASNVADKSMTDKTRLASQTQIGFLQGGYMSLARFSAAPFITVLSLFASMLVTGVRFESPYFVLAAVSAMFSLLILRPAFTKSLIESSHARTVGLILGGWLTIVGVMLLLAYGSKISDEFSRATIFVWIALCSAGLVAAHYLLDSLARWAVTRTNLVRRVAIAGINDISVQLAEKLDRHAEVGLKVVGFFDDRGEDRHDRFDGKLLGKLTDLPEFARKGGVDVVFVSLPIRHVKRASQLLDELHDTTSSIYYLPDVFVFDLIQSRNYTICGLPAIALCETPFFGYQGLLKRALDITASIACILVASPVLLLISILIRITSPGSVIFAQRRYGLDGREIMVYKFRSMYVSEDGRDIVQAKREDARVTPVGRILRKTSLDELPQLINVLQGRMSLVGPRPHAVSHNEEYRKLIKGYMFRHKVLPGMTGWAQINGYRGGTEKLEDMQARVDHDLDYLRNWSFGLDVKILLMTLPALLRGDRAY